MHRRDALAATSFDLLFERHPEAKEVGLAGWITQPGAKVDRVFLLKRQDEEIRQAYVAVYEEGKEPFIEPHLDEPLPDDIALRFAARKAAIAAIPGFYDLPYNFEVLDDPDGDGFLVYSLVASKAANEMVVGGHSRITVSVDGKTVEQIDELSRSLLIMDKNLEEGKEFEGAVVSHVVSNTSVETHVFVSLLHGQPFFIVTPDGAIWHVKEGKITKTDMKAGGNESDSGGEEDSKAEDD